MKQLKPLLTREERKAIRVLKRIEHKLCNLKHKHTLKVIESSKDYAYRLNESIGFLSDIIDDIYMIGLDRKEK